MWRSNRPDSAALLCKCQSGFFFFPVSQRIVWINTTWHIQETPTPRHGTTWVCVCGAGYREPQPPLPLPLLFLLLIGGGLGAVTIIADAKFYTLVQVHDRPEGFFDWEIFELDISTRRLLTCCKRSATKYDRRPRNQGQLSFLSLFWEGTFLQALKQSRCPPCKQRLMTRWGGEINTIKSDRENTLLWLTSHKSMLFSKNNPRSYLSGSYSHICKIGGENRQRSLVYCAKFHTRSYTLNSQCTVHMLGSFKQNG